MYILKVQGARRSTLAVHHCDSRAEVRELSAVYLALGHSPEALLVEIERREQAA